MGRDATALRESSNQVAMFYGVLGRYFCVSPGRYGKGREGEDGDMQQLRPASQFVMHFCLQAGY